MERTEKKAVALKRMEMTPEVLDYRKHFFSEDFGREFMDEIFGLDDTPDLKGADFLDFLLTPSAVDVYNAPRADDWKYMDFGSLGRSRDEIRTFLEAKTTAEGKTFPDYFADRLLRHAFTLGLTYRLIDPNTGMDYYGVPYHVRSELGLQEAAEAKAEIQKEQVAAETKAFAEGLKALAEQVKDLPAKDEIFEYAAQLCLTGVEQGVLSESDLPPALLEKVSQLGLIPPQHFMDLTVLLEASEGTEFFATAKTLCELAVAAGQLSQDDLDDSLASLV